MQAAGEIARNAIRRMFALDVLFAIALFAALPFLLSLLVYLFAKSLLIAPSGLFAYVGLAVGVGALLVAVFFKVRHMKEAVAIRREGGSARFSLMPILLFHLAVNLLIPPAVVLTARQTLTEPFVARSGKTVRRLSETDSLRLNLREMERRGIFTLLVR